MKFRNIGEKIEEADKRLNTEISDRLDSNLNSTLKGKNSKENNGAKSDGEDKQLKILRFCFAKKNETIDKAAKILCRI